MSGGFRLLLISLLVGIAATAALADDASVKSSAAKPPLAPQQPVEDVVQGHKIIDPYRWLENAVSPETQQWVSEEMAYTRGVLDPLPGREQLHQRLTDLLSIGTIGAPQIGGRYYFYTKREG
jgi:prolyl oligopeptidase